MNTVTSLEWWWFIPVEDLVYDFFFGVTFIMVSTAHLYMNIFLFFLAVKENCFIYLFHWLLAHKGQEMSHIYAHKCSFEPAMVGILFLHCKDNRGVSTQNKLIHWDSYRQRATQMALSLSSNCLLRTHSCICWGTPLLATASMTISRGKWVN